MKLSALSIVLGLAIGLGAGYYWGQSKSTKIPLTTNHALTAEEKDFYDTHAFQLSGPDSVKNHIDTNYAKKIITAFERQNDTAQFPLMSNKGKLHGFFIDRLALDHILSNNTWDGVNVLFAKKPGTCDRCYTMVFLGGRYKDKDSTSILHNPLKPTGHIHIPKLAMPMTGPGDTLTYDYVKPCPDVCTDFDDPPSVATAKRTGKPNK